jgi:hypothetical protein
VIPFDRDSQRDEREVDNAATGLIGRTRARAAYLEMCEIDEARQSSNEGRNICRSMEERWILISQKFCDVFIVVLCLTRTWFCLRLIREAQFFSSLWVDQWRKKGLRRMWNIEGQVLDVIPKTVKGSHSGRPSKSVRLECDGQILEQSRRSPCAEIMTDES